MWLILTVVFGIATYLAVLWFDSLLPAIILMVLAIGFLGLNWTKGKGRN